MKQSLNTSSIFAAAPTASKLHWQATSASLIASTLTPHKAPPSTCMLPQRKRKGCREECMQLKSPDCRIYNQANGLHALQPCMHCNPACLSQASRCCTVKGGWLAAKTCFCWPSMTMPRLLAEFHLVVYMDTDTVKLSKLSAVQTTTVLLSSLGRTFRYP